VRFKFWRRSDASGPHRATSRRIAASAQAACTGLTAPPPGTRVPARRGVWALCLNLEHWQAVEKMGGRPKVLFVVPQGRVQAGRVSNLLHLTAVDGNTSNYGCFVDSRMLIPSNVNINATDSHSAARKDNLCRMRMSTLGGSCFGCRLSVFVDNGSVAHAPHVTSTLLQSYGTDKPSTDRASTDVHAFQAPSNLKGRPLARVFI
jgi:hypothetical protein